MKLRISAFCWTCLKEAGNTKEDYDQLLVERPEMRGDYLVEVNDDNLYRIECQKGHVTFTYQQQQKFELLFDFGAMALLDGYTREAVASMSAALERFYEFYVLIICLKEGIAFSDIESTWRLMAKQSERQLGAYLVLSLLNNNTCTPDLNRRAEFRNKVIHQGYIPSTEEAIDYGDYVLSIIFPVLKDLRKFCEKELRVASSRHILKIREKFIDGARVMSSSGPTIINMQSLFANDFGAGSFASALEAMRNNSYSRICFVREMRRNGCSDR